MGWSTSVLSTEEIPSGIHVDSTPLSALFSDWWSFAIELLVGLLGLGARFVRVDSRNKTRLRPGLQDISILSLVIFFCRLFSFCVSGAILSFLRWLCPLFSSDIFSIRYFNRGSWIELRSVRWCRELVSVVEKNRVAAYFCLFLSKIEDWIRVWTTSENHHPKPTNLILSTVLGSGNLSGITFIIQLRTEFLPRLISCLTMDSTALTDLPNVVIVRRRRCSCRHFPWPSCYWRPELLFLGIQQCDEMICCLNDAPPRVMTTIACRKSMLTVIWEQRVSTWWT
jgi:hypothetical protein